MTTTTLAARRAPKILLALVLLACTALAAAQPYAAAGGFDRPLLRETTVAVASVAVAVSPSGAITSTVWADSSGVWRQDRAAEGVSAPTQVAVSDGVRSVSAAYVGDDLAVAWVVRDRRTGVYHHEFAWDGQERLLFDDPLMVGLRLFDWRGEPWAAGLFRREGEGQIRLLPLASGTSPEANAVVAYRTDLSLRGLDLVVAPSGALWLGWLEGKNERGEFGLISEWDSYVAELPAGGAGGASLRGPLVLGEADVEDERQRVELLLPPGAGDEEGVAETVRVLWPDSEGDLRLTEVYVGGEELTATSTSAALGRGRPLGASWPHLFWSIDSSVRRLDITDGAQLNVAWSPVTIEGASFDTADDVSAIGWYGRAQGGAVQIFGTDDRTPMELRWTDRLAATMGWSPWHLWDEFVGQALTALLAGVLVAMLVVPILMIVTPFLVRFFRRQRRAVTAGVVLGLLPLLGAGLLLVRLLGYGADDPLGALLTVGAAALVGVVVGWLATRGGDREAQGTMTLAGATTTFAAFTLWSFLTYNDWAPLVGL